MEFKRYIRPGKGAADIMPVLRDGALFHRLIDALAALFAGTAVDKVACVEGRGFLLGAAVAYRLNAGLVPLRHQGKLKSALETYSVTFTDYSRSEKALEIQHDGVSPGERVLIIDDWAETAATINAALRLIERCGGTVVGIGVLMDDTSPSTRASLQQYNYRFLEQAAATDSF